MNISLRSCGLALSVVLTFSACGGGNGSGTPLTSNVAPVADAGAVQNVVTGSVVTLSGSGSSDVDGDPLTYRWAVVSRPDGSSSQLSSLTSAEPTFIPDVSGIYVFSLIVSDGTLESAAATVTVTASSTLAVPTARPILK